MSSEPEPKVKRTKYIKKLPELYLKRGRKARAFTKEEIEKYQKMKSENFTNKDIAKELEMSKYLLSKIAIHIQTELGEHRDSSNTQAQEQSSIPQQD